MRGGLCGLRSNCYALLYGRPSVVYRTPVVIDPIARCSSIIIAIFAYPTCIRHPR